MSTTHEAPAESDSGPAQRSVPGGIPALGALLWRRRWMIVLVFVLVANAVAAGLVLADKEYTASARVAATPQQDLTPSPASYEDLLGTVADVAESRPLLEEVAAELSGRSADQLRDHVEAEVVPGTVIIQVSVSDTDPERAVETADLVVERLSEYDPTAGAFDYQVTEQAAVPESFSSPDIPMTVLAGLALAVVLAIAAAVVVDRVFRTVTEPEEMGEVSETVVLGAVPKPDDPQGVPAVEFMSPEFQAVRALRIAVEFASAEEPTRLLVVSSASGSDPWAGWIEVNLAAALAEVGHRVLVVNGNREEGPVHPALEASGEPGLYDVLAGVADLDDAVRGGPVELVDVLPLGTAHLAAPGLLEMRFRGLLEDTEERYDVVIVHAAPIPAAEDARIMGIHGAILMVVPSGTVHPRFVRKAAEHLRGIRLRVLGSVLMGVRRSRRPRRPQTA